MPLSLGRLSVFLMIISIGIIEITGQTLPQTSVTQTNTLPTSADVMRTRVSKAKAYVAVKNYAAAIYELEGIRRDINEPSVNGVVQVMLMNCYLEQLDYKRAQSFLTEIFNFQKANKPNTNYFAIAGQVVKSAKNQLDRYRSLGLSVADRNLPTEAAADVNKMRETVEMVVEQSKTLGADKKLTADSMALLEQATTARGNLARDDYDAKRWKEEVADARETIANSNSKVINAVDDGSPIGLNNSVASNQSSPVIPKTSETNSQVNPAIPVPKPVIENVSKAAVSEPRSGETADFAKTDSAEKKTVELTSAPTSDSNSQTAQKNEPQTSQQGPAAKDEGKPEPTAEPNLSPLELGSMIEYATEKVNPTYPIAARTVRMTGVVKVDLVVDEQGKVAIQNTTGPSMLQRAALDAIKKWKFKPFMRDGQPVKATGFVSFNFNL